MCVFHDCVFTNYSILWTFQALFLWIVCSWVHALWISVNNFPTRCDYIQFLFPANCSTCFGWYLHPSSGARVNCNYSIWHQLNRITTFRCHGGVWLHSSGTGWTVLLPSAVVESDPFTAAEGSNTVPSVPDAVITVYTCSWWWVKVSPETCRAVCRK